MPRQSSSRIGPGGSSPSSTCGDSNNTTPPRQQPHEDSEQDFSDVSSSGHTSEDSQARRRRRRFNNKGSGSVSGSEDFEWVRQSPMLTGLLEGHVTRLATPPDLRHHHHHHRTSGSGLVTPPESGEEAAVTGALPNHRQQRHYTRPPPAPRPRTLEPGDLLPHRPALRDSRERVYTPSRDHHVNRRSRDSSSERLRDSSCDRASSSVVLHQSPHLPHHHNYHGSHYPARSHCECVACCADEDEAGYDSCSDERHHRHSYHEGVHHQPGHHQHHHHQHHHHSRDSSRDRRAPSRQGVSGPPDSGRSSPCCCRSHLGSCSSLSSPQQDYFSGSGASKGVSLEERVQRLESDKGSLQLQVTVLTEQVEAQTEKIHDLENLLDQKKSLLLKTEEHLQKEVMTRSSLETQRLQLLSEISNLKLRQVACESENVELRDKLRRSDHSEHKGQLLTAAQVGSSPSPSTISTLSTIPASSPNKASPGPGSGSPPASPLSSNDVRDFSQPRLSKTPPPNARRKIDQFGTLPRNQKDLINHDGEINHGSATTGRTQKGVMFAETERQMLDDLHDGYLGDGGLESQRQVSSSHVALTGPRSPPTSHKTTGIKKIFTRLRRSSSGQIEAGSDLGDGDFKRGGTRSTASARLGWSTPISTFKEPSSPFNTWNIDTVDSWLSSLGLNHYIAAVRSWTESGHHLSKATSHQLERELGFRHPLHKKKIQLAISARLSGEDLNTPLARLDHTWVLRWLDDIGLPQYKDAFSDARIDGRVLNCLTYDDLAFLRFSNLLHVTSLKRGIQVLRLHNFDCTVLKRRSVPEEGQRHRTPTEVALWTNHRVMEWLRTVDLSEYAPNLRGSGVHGALMVYEVRFTSELLAAILSIPSSKTLLRRHLNTHFKELVGQTTVQEKRELQVSPGHQPLTTSSKVKMPKKSQFSLKRKKSKSDLEFDDLLCPLDEKPPLGVQQDKEKETNGDGRLC